MFFNKTNGFARGIGHKSRGRNRSISYRVSRSRRQYSRLSHELAGWNWPSRSLEASCRTQSRRSRGAFVYPVARSGRGMNGDEGGWMLADSARLAGSMLKALGSFLRPSSVEIRGNHSRLNRCTASNPGVLHPRVLHPSKNSSSSSFSNNAAPLAKPPFRRDPRWLCFARYRFA